MLPTSEPGGSPGGMTPARPTSARAASASSVGVDAASSGVRPPSSATGSSAQPSGTQTTYFMRGFWPIPRPSRSGGGVEGGFDEVADDRGVVGDDLVALRALEEVGEVGREGRVHPGGGLDR